MTLRLSRINLIDEIFTSLKASLRQHNNIFANMGPNESEDVFEVTSAAFSHSLDGELNKFFLR